MNVLQVRYLVNIFNKSFCFPFFFYRRNWKTFDPLYGAIDTEFLACMLFLRFRELKPAWQTQSSKG